MQRSLSFLLFLLLGLPARSQENTTAPVTPVNWEVQKYRSTVFNAGEAGIDSYRIPSLVTTKAGSLLAFAEARKESSTDKTPTDIVVKRSTDQGKTWSDMQFLTRGGEDAYMDPVALADLETGKIFLFANLWPAGDHSMKANTAWVMTSADDGVTWSVPVNITEQITAEGHFMNGFGPGSGIQMKGAEFKGRLILPTRQFDGENLRNRAVYSDDHGQTWKIGEAASTGGEYEIAEAPPGVLVYNLRAGNGIRKKAWSHDGGTSWGAAETDEQLETTSDYGGCQSSVLGVGELLFFSGPGGGDPDQMHEDRQHLFLYRSPDGGVTWDKGLLLYDKAAGYSDLTELPDGDLALIFESGDTEGFPRMIPGNRPPGWMRIDVLLISEEVKE